MFSGENVFFLSQTRKAQQYIKHNKFDPIKIRNLLHQNTLKKKSESQVTIYKKMTVIH